MKTQAEGIKQGTEVEVLVRAGGVAKGEAASATKFVGTIEPGQRGLYIGKVPGDLGNDGWHVVSVGAWDVPLHSSQFRPVSS